MTDGFRLQVMAQLAPIAASPATQQSAVALRALTHDILDAVCPSREAALRLVAAAFEASTWSDRALDRALLSAIIALHLELPRTLCRDAISAALVCDLGERLLPSAAVNDVSAWAMHARLSVDLLSPQALTPRAQRAVLEHHERLDGSGQPFGLTADGLDLVGRIVAVADVYSQLRLTGRSPAEAVEAMRETALPGLDRAVFGALVEARACTLFGWERVPA